MYVEILKINSSPRPAMTTVFTTTKTISAAGSTVSQQFSRFTTMHHTSGVSPVMSTTSGVNNVSQLPQGVLICS